MFKCPKCDTNTKVKDSRGFGVFIRRRRQCRKCEFRFRTVERYEAKKLKKRGKMNGSENG